MIFTYKYHFKGLNHLKKKNIMSRIYCDTNIYSIVLIKPQKLH